MTEGSESAPICDDGQWFSGTHGGPVHLRVRDDGGDAEAILSVEVAEQVVAALQSAIAEAKAAAANAAEGDR